MAKPENSFNWDFGETGNPKQNTHLNQHTKKKPKLDSSQENKLAAEIILQQDLNLSSEEDESMDRSYPASETKRKRGRSTEPDIYARHKDKILYFSTICDYYSNNSNVLNHVRTTHNFGNASAADLTNECQKLTTEKKAEIDAKKKSVPESNE